MEIKEEQLTLMQKRFLKIMKVLEKNPRIKLRKMGLPVSTAHEVMVKLLKKVKYRVTITKKKGKKETEIPKELMTQHQKEIEQVKEAMLEGLNKNPRASNMAIAKAMGMNRSKFHRRVKGLEKNYNIKLKWIQEEVKNENKSERL